MKTKKSKKVSKYWVFPVMIVMAIIGLLIVNDTCNSYAEVQSRIDNRQQDIIEYEQQESKELEEIVEQVNKLAEEENQRQKDYYECTLLVKDEDVKTLGNVIYGEARGLSDTEKSGVAWCILNRVDNGKYGKTIYDVTTAKNQFTGYNAKRTYKSEQAKALLNHCEELARDILVRYYMEQRGYDNVGRTLPNDYLYFHANKEGTHNMYSKEWKSTNYWDWSMESPYED